MGKYDWNINGRRFSMKKPFAGAFDISLDERVQIEMVIDTSMSCPLHLHGHSFQLGNNGARKDTVIGRPKETVTFKFEQIPPEV